MNNLIDNLHRERLMLQEKEQSIRLLTDPKFLVHCPDSTKAEVADNIILAVRHIEDARMRLGKAIQHAENRPSIYDAAERSAASNPDGK